MGLFSEDIDNVRDKVLKALEIHHVFGSKVVYIGALTDADGQLTILINPEDYNKFERTIFSIGAATKQFQVLDSSAHNLKADVGLFIYKLSPENKLPADRKVNTMIARVFGYDQSPDEIVFAEVMFWED